MSRPLAPEQQPAAGSAAPAASQPPGAESPGGWLALFRGPTRWVAIISLLVALPSGTLELLLPLYAGALGAAPTAIGALFGAGAALNLLVRPLAGMAIDRGAVRGVLLGGLGAYLLALGCFAAADRYGLLLAGRLALAGGAACVGLALNVLIARLTARDERGAGYGALTSASFWGYVAGSVVAGLVLGLWDAETQREVRAALAAFNLSLPLPAGLPRLGALHLLYAGYACLGLSALWAFARLPRDGAEQPPAAREPLLRVWRRLLGQPAMRVVLLTGWLIVSAYNLAVPMLLRSLQDRFGAGLGSLAIAYAIPGVLYAAAPAPLGRLADRWGRRRAAIAGLSASAGVYLALPLLPSLGWAALVWSCEALAYSLYVPAVLALLSNAVPAEQRGVSFGLYSVVGSLGAVVAAPLGGWLYERQTALLPFSLTALALAAAAWVLYRFGHALPQSGPAEPAKGAV